MISSVPRVIHALTIQVREIRLVNLRIFSLRGFHGLGGFVFDLERIPFFNFSISELSGLDAPIVERLRVIRAQFGMGGADAFVNRLEPVFAPFQTHIERDVEQFGRDVADVNCAFHARKYGKIERAYDR